MMSSTSLLPGLKPTHDEQGRKERGHHLTQIRSDRCMSSEESRLFQPFHHKLDSCRFLLGSLEHGGSFQLNNGIESCVSHPLRGLARFVTPSLLRVDQNMHGKRCSPCRAGSRFVQE